jgi:hypothetical protein
MYKAIRTREIGDSNVRPRTTGRGAPATPAGACPRIGAQGRAATLPSLFCGMIRLHGEEVAQFRSDLPLLQCGA